MSTYPAPAFDGRIMFVGFGSIGQGLLPVLMQYLKIPNDRISIITADERTATGRGTDLAKDLGITQVHIQPLTKDNHRTILEPLLTKGDFLVNLSVDVSSVDLMLLCRERGVLYIDTCVEPWAGFYRDANLPVQQRSNYALRESMLQHKTSEPQPTAVVCCGANPGLVSWFVKEALLHLDAETRKLGLRPKSRAEWAAFAQALGVKAIHIAERDTQISPVQKAMGEFVNTWSIDGFDSEGSQPAELGWGSHEKNLPRNAHTHEKGSRAAIYLERPGREVRVRSWTPLAGAQHAFLITHNESIGIADYYTKLGSGDSRTPEYRPTVHYAYHPCDSAVLSLHELNGRNGRLQERKRLIMDDIESGIDELGVLLMGHDKGAYWWGSRLSIEAARRLAPHNNATSLQVVAGVLGGMVCAMEHPMSGIVEADELDHAVAMDVARPLLGEMAGAFSDWTPLKDRDTLFPEDIDKSDPWQFKNFLVQ